MHINLPHALGAPHIFSRSKADLKKLGKVDKDIEHLLDRIVEASSPIIIHAFEKRIDDLQKQRLILEEKISKTGYPVKPFDVMYRTSMLYLKNPFHIWQLGNLQRSAPC